MGLLGIFGLGRVLARRRGQVGFAEIFENRVAGSSNAFRCNVHAIGTHIGDQANRIAVNVHALIQALGHLHGLGRREAQLSRGLLLQGRGAKWRIRVPFGRFAFNVIDRNPDILQGLLDGARRSFVLDIELADPLSGNGLQRGVEFLALRRGKGTVDRPVFLALERFDLKFPVADDAQRHRLDPAGRAGTRQLPPQHGRQGKAHKIVQGAPGQIGVNQSSIHVPRVLHGLKNGLLGNGVKHHPLDLLVLQRALFLQNLKHMPGNGFAFPVGVGRQNKPVVPFKGIGDISHALRRLAVHLPRHGKILVRAHRAVLGGQIAHMAVGGQNGEA